MYLGKGTECSRFQCCALKPFVMGDVAFYIQVCSVCLSEEQAFPSHHASHPKTRAQCKTCCLGCLCGQRREAGTSRWQLSLAVLKWDELSSGYFFLPPVTLSCRPGSDFRITKDRGGESLPWVLSGQSYAWGLAQATALQQRQLELRESFCTETRGISHRKVLSMRD